MTHREARKKLGSRHNRKANTNGKNMWSMPAGSGGRINFKYRYPHPVNNKAAVKVARMVRESAVV